MDFSQFTGINFLAPETRNLDSREDSDPPHHMTDMGQSSRCCIVGANDINDVPFTSNFEKKKKRGSYEYVTEPNGCQLVRWNDNSIDNVDLPEHPFATYSPFCSPDSAPFPLETSLTPSSPR